METSTLLEDLRKEEDVGKYWNMTRIENLLMSSAIWQSSDHLTPSAI